MRTAHWQLLGQVLRAQQAHKERLQAALAAPGTRLPSSSRAAALTEVCTSPAPVASLCPPVHGSFRLQSCALAFSSSRPATSMTACLPGGQRGRPLRAAPALRLAGSGGACRRWWQHQVTDELAAGAGGICRPGGQPARPGQPAPGTHLAAAASPAHPPAGAACSRMPLSSAWWECASTHLGMQVVFPCLQAQLSGKARQQRVPGPSSGSCSVPVHARQQLVPCMPTCTQLLLVELQHV